MSAQPTISTEKTTPSKNPNDQRRSSLQKRHGTSEELESLRIEYQNLFDRSNKLDNKTYITITFCGFMFVFITSLFGSISQIQLSKSGSGSPIMVLYIIVCVAVAVSYVWNLIWFMQLLAPEGIIRLDPDKIAGAELDKCSVHEAERRLIALYRNIINEDLEKLHIRCDKFVMGLRYVLLTLILSFVCYGLQILLQVM